jgi:predicted site-specific integrase-resolvase
MNNCNTDILVNEKQDSLLTTKDVAGILGIHVNTVRRWSDLGLLKSFRISLRGDRRYKYKDITSFLGGINEKPLLTM